MFMVYAPTVSASAPGASSQWFKTEQGKVAELRVELASGGRKDKNNSAKKIALKKIVANMTMSNNDMVALFPDIINCMTIPSLEIKKMYESIGRQVWKTHSLDNMADTGIGASSFWSTTQE